MLEEMGVKTISIKANYGLSFLPLAFVVGLKIQMERVSISLNLHFYNTNSQIP